MYNRNNKNYKTMKDLGYHPLLDKNVKFYVREKGEKEEPHSLKYRYHRYDRDKKRR